MVTWSVGSSRPALVGSTAAVLTGGGVIVLLLVDSSWRRSWRAFLRSCLRERSLPTKELAPTTAPTASPAGSGKWQLAVAQASWGARTDLRLATCNAGVVLLAGYSGRRHSDCWWTADGRSWCCWLRDEDAQFSRRIQHSLVSRPDGVLLAGGQTAGWRVVNDVWHLSPSGDCRKVAGVSSQKERPGSKTDGPVEAAAPWRPRSDFGMVELDDGTIMVAGGANGRRVLDDVVWATSYEPNAKIRKEAAPWGPRRGLCAVALPHSRAIVFGGASGDGRLTRDVWCWASGKWHSLGEAPWEARTAAAACIVPAQGSRGAQVVVCGGLGASLEGNAKQRALADVWCLEVGDDPGFVPNNDDWRRPCDSEAFPARSGHGLAWSPSANCLVVAGGVATDGRFLGDAWVCPF